MDEQRRAKLAAALSKNALLPELLGARAQEIREAWEAEQDRTLRELNWVELKALNDLKDFIYARLDELSERERTE